MKSKGWMKNSGIALLGAGWLVSGHLHADVVSSDGYSVEDFTLRNAADLVDVCTVEAKHPDYELAMTFCYGFFEGAAHYDDAVSASEWYDDIVCDPPGTTRSQAVDVFIRYMQANPQYGSEPSVDAIFRALVDKWPCE